MHEPTNEQIQDRTDGLEPDLQTGAVLVAERPSLPATVTGQELMVRPGDDLVAPTRTAAAYGVAPPPIPPSRGDTATPARRRSLAVLLAGLVAAAAVGAALVGGSGSDTRATAPTSTDPAHALAAAAQQSTAASSVAFTVAATTSTSLRTTSLLTGAGSLDVATGVADVSATIPALATVVGADHSTLQVLSDGSAAYVDVPVLGTLTGGASWLKIDVPAGSAAGANRATLSVLADPARLVNLLTELGGTVTDLGTVDLSGTPTTEYAASLSLSELAGRATSAASGSSTAASATASIVSALGALGSASIPVHAWVGKDGYVRQMQVSLDLSPMSMASLASLATGLAGSDPTSGPSTMAATVTVGLSHYGAPVHVTVPPASEVTDVSGVASSVAGGFGHLGKALSSWVASI